MFVLAAVPPFLPQISKYFEQLFLFGTGALLGLCVFDLFPEIFEAGGALGISIVLSVWVLYSAFHVFYSHHHTHTIDPALMTTQACERKKSPYIFLFSISLHCFTSGLLLGVSGDFSKKLSTTIFTVLLAHKIFETTTVSSLLLTYKKKAPWTLGMLAIYIFSLPLGVLFTDLFKEKLNHVLILWISGVALGSLAGCLVFDFMIPSYAHIKNRRVQIIWFLLGMFLPLLFRTHP